METKVSKNEARTAESIIRDLERLRASACIRCGQPLCPHQLLMSIALGFKNSLRCLPCLGKSLEYDPARIRDSLWEFIRSRDCYLGAWNWASRAAGFPENAMPQTLMAFEKKPADTVLPKPVAPSSSEMDISATWNAGDMGCGDLVLELRLRLQALRPGEIMQLCARDPGAPEDLPAWCRLTGHTLLRAEHPDYWIKRKE